MPNLLVAEDFFSTGALDNPPWGSGASQFSRESGRAYGAVAPGSTALATMTAVDPKNLMTASTPRLYRYEVDVRMPDTLPAASALNVGLGALMQATGRDGLRLLYRRTAGGASVFVELSIARPTGSALADVSLFSAFAPGSFTALSAAATARLRLDVQDLGWGLLCNAYLDGVLMFVSAPSLVLFNATTGRSLATFNDATLYPAVQVLASGTATSAGVPQSADRTYVDRLRVYDMGSLATTPRLSIAPALTTAATLTPLTPAGEDELTIASLTVHPSYPIAWTPTWLVDEHPYDGGYAAKVARQTRKRRSAPFHWDALSSSQKTTLETLRDAMSGTLNTFSYTDRETGDTLRLRFVEDPKIVQVAPAVWQADAQVEEVLTSA